MVNAFLFIYLAVPRSLRDLCSLTGDKTHAPAVKLGSLNH